MPSAFRTLLARGLGLLGAWVWLGGSPGVQASGPRLTWRGEVQLKGRREPIEGAGVFLRELRRGAYTDAKGRFRIPKVKPGTYTLIVKAIGYKGLRKKVKIGPSPKKINLYLEVDPKQKLQTTVRAKRVRHAPGQLAITRKDIGELAGGLGNDAFRALQNLPGVARSGGLSGSLRIRGASPQDTGFLMDGHRLPLLYHFGGGPAIISDRFINAIDFYPGGAPVTFGRFTAGLVSVHSRNPNQKAIHGEVFVDIIHAGLFLEIPITKHFGIALAARRSYVDAVIPLFTTDALVARYWDYQLKLAYQRGRHKLTLFLFGSDDVVDYEGQKSGDELPFLGEDPFYLAMRFGRAILQYRYGGKAFDVWLSASAGFDNTGIKSAEQEADLWVYPIDFRAELRWKVHKRLRFDLGFDGGWQRHTYRFDLPAQEFLSFPRPSSSANDFRITGEGEKDATFPGFYLNVHWQPHDALRLDTGLRVDLVLHQERLVYAFDPRLSVRWQVHKHWTLLLASGLFHRTPDIQQWSEEAGNPDLQLQAAFQVASGVEWSPFRQLNVRAQAFFTYMYDRINRSNRTIEEKGKLRSELYNNEGLGRSYGFELLIRLKKWRGLSGWLAYTLSRAERGNLNSGINRLYNYDQTHIMNLLLQYDFGHGWKVAARFRLATGRPTTPVVGSFYDADVDRYRPVYGPADSERRPTFHQLDLRVDKTWTFNTWALGVYLDLINVYNNQNIESYRYSFDYNQRFPVTGIPIIPAFGIKGTF